MCCRRLSIDVAIAAARKLIIAHALGCLPADRWHSEQSAVGATNSHHQHIEPQTQTAASVCGPPILHAPALMSSLPPAGHICPQASVPDGPSVSVSGSRGIIPPTKHPLFSHHIYQKPDTHHVPLFRDPAGRGLRGQICCWQRCCVVEVLTWQDHPKRRGAGVAVTSASTPAGRPLLERRRGHSNDLLFIGIGAVSRASLLFNLCGHFNGQCARFV